MSDIGVFAVHRGIWTHPLFADDAFTEREAWLWLISHAVWKPTRVRVSHKIVSLDRGQLAFSIRFLAEKWKWSKSSVHRFLARLRDENMIEQNAGQELTHITICNYNKYAFDGDAGRDRNGTGTGQSRDKEEEGNNLRIDRIAEARGVSSFTEGSKALASSLWKALGITHPIQIPPELAGADWRALEWEKAGWTVDLIDAEARRIGPGKPLIYYEKVFATTFAKRQAPLPVVEIREAETLTVTHGTSRPKTGNSLIAAIDRQLAALQEADRTDLEVSEGAVLRLSSGSIR